MTIIQMIGKALRQRREKTRYALPEFNIRKKEMRTVV